MTTQSANGQTANSVPGLSRQAITEISETLKQLLADVFTLYLKTKRFHWDICGRHLRDYHLLLDHQAEQIFAMIDDIAEGARKIGGYSLRSIGDTGRHQRIKDAEDGRVLPRQMLSELRDDNAELTRFPRSAHEVSAQRNDGATTSMIEGWIDQTERRTWFLTESHQSSKRTVRQFSPCEDCRRRPRLQRHTHIHTAFAATKKGDTTMKHTSSALFIAVGLLSQPANAQVQEATVQGDLTGTALVVVDPQVDFLSAKGATWALVGKSVEANHTVTNLETLFRAAKTNDVPVFISPHYYYPWDHKWEPSGGTGEEMFRKLKPFQRAGPLTVQGFENSGADWMPQYKQFINDGRTVIASPHKLYGPEVNDLVLQLRKRRVEKVILAGMSANLCIESHMRYLLEQGFTVAVVKDATAAFQLPGLDGYAAALTNFQMIANAVLTTGEVIRAFEGYGASK